jgi:hypothetical protein
MVEVSFSIMVPRGLGGFIVRKKQDMARIQVEISPEKLKELEALMAEAGIPTKREFFDLVVGLFKWTVKEVKNNRIIASMDEEHKTYKELYVPAFDTVAKKSRRSVTDCGNPIPVGSL